MKLAKRLLSKPFWFASIIPVGVMILVVACRGQMLSEPVGDLDPVLALCPSAEFDTLDGWPRTTTHIRKSRSEWLNEDKVLEILELDEGQTEFMFTLFANSVAATRYYESRRRTGPGVAPVKLEKVVDGNVRGFLRYVIRPRAGGGGMNSPMDYYMSDAVLQLRNAVVEVEVRLGQKDARDMEGALKRLSEILKSPQAVQLQKSLAP